jgi:methionine aminopeptidase
VGATVDNPVTGRRADVLKAAWHAAEAAMRLIKAGNKNSAVTEVVGKVATNWGCKPVEGELLAPPSLRLDFTVMVGMLSCQQTQNVIDGKKRIIQNPTESQRRDFETITFAENEVYGMDVLVSSGEDGKVNPLPPRSPARTEFF